jgi:hypothetical protein
MNQEKKQEDLVKNIKRKIMIFKSPGVYVIETEINDTGWTLSKRQIRRIKIKRILNELDK